jgi:hypothetical protein
MSERNATFLSIQFKLDLAPGTGRDELHAHGELLMQQLLKLEECNTDFTDSTVSTDARANTLTVDLLVLDATEPAAILQRALDIARTAIHAAGGATPRWPVVNDQPDHVEMAKARDLMPA